MSRRGFGTVRRLPSGRYQASHMHGGARHQAPYTFQTKLDAGAWLAQRQADITRGAWPEPAQAPRSSPGFAQYAADCLGARTLSGNTPDNYAQLLNAHLMPTFGALRLRDITPPRVREWYAMMGRKQIPTARARAYGLLVSVLRTAVSDGLIPESPCRIRGGADVPVARAIEPATPYEIDAIATAMPDRLRMMVELAAWCALRLGEVAALERADIELDDGLASGRVRVRRSLVWPKTGGAPYTKDPKSRAGTRDVEIPPELLPRLVNHLARHVRPGGNALVFPALRDPRAYIAQATVRQRFVQACEAAGRPDLRFHDLRHTGLTIAAQHGATLGELMHRAGHASPRMAMRYQHATRQRDRALAARLMAPDELAARRNRGDQ